jgi:hypothetical protein
LRDAFVWIEQSALGDFMRTSSLWTYAIVNVLHVLGIGSLFGAAMVMDLRLLGVWHTVPLRTITTAAVPVAAAGLLLALVTGAGLFATQATEYLGNPFLFIKFAAIAVGVANAAAVRGLPAWQMHSERELSPKERRNLAIVGAISLAAWIAAIAAGRLIAYW